MTDRPLKLWMPGAAACSVFFGFYFALSLLGVIRDRSLLIAIPYLVLPFAGALGAWLSRRMDGSVVDRILAALFPAFAFVTLFAVRVVYGLFFEGVPYTLPHFLHGLALTLLFAVVGGLLLVLGAFPFFRANPKEQSPQ